MKENSLTTQTLQLASMIDHTILKADTTREQVKKVCLEALEHKFASVCVNPSYVSYVSQMLKGSNVKTCTVVGFPLGATTTKAKVDETIDVLNCGAQEVDMVINVGAIKSRDWDFVKKDIEEVVLASKEKAIVKVIIEACLMTDAEKVMACRVSKEAGAHFVKTSTGFSAGGATIEDIALMRKEVGSNLGVKASGGIKDFAKAIAMIQAGANRIGTSSGIEIVSYEKQL
jgi:deoxyribose-phosphate aldolase